MKFRLALLTATVLAAPFAFSHAASAQPVTGPYVAGGAGYNIESSQKAKDFAAKPGETKIVTNNGWTGEASLGYGFGNGFRAEVEGDYINDSFSKTKYAGTDYRSRGGES